MEATYGSKASCERSGIIIVTAVWAIRRFSPRDTGSAPTNAMRVLEERFARGEIDADEFQRRRDILRRD
jgi:putative membrane protein